MPMDGRKGVPVPSAWYLSARLSRETMSAVRSSTAAFGLQNVHDACSGMPQYGGTGEPPSTQRPEGVWTMRPVDAE